jgi:hypothetical protein
MNLKTIRAGVGRVLAVAAMTAVLPSLVWGQAQTCNGLVTIDYVTGSNFAVPGDTLRVRLTLGTASINGGTQLTIQRLKFDLDCNSNFALGLPCTDEGSFVEYEGDSTITNTCGKTFTTGHATSATPNEVVFMPNTPIVIPANQAVPPGFCNIEFDIKVLASPSIDATPNFIEEVGGFTNLDAMCNNGILASGGTQTGDIPLCPTCTGTQCTTSACNQTTGLCESTNLPDSTPCTDSDGNACTTAGCDAGVCNQAHNTTVCTPDNNECTQDPACNPQTGLCDHPPVPDSTPCADSDGNACTTAGCDAGQCNQSHHTTVCTPDNNECTLDPACNPATGQCTHPPSPDSTPCTDTDNNACTAAGCEAGQCVQSHIPVCQTPDHFQCYEIKPKAFATVTGVSVQDQFGQHTESVRLAHRLCAPANKNGEDPTAPTHPDHLQGHIVSGPNVKVANLTVTNQFGDIKLDTVKPDVLLAPTLKTLALPGPTAPPSDPNVPDHFQCYKVKRSKGSPKFQKILGVTVQDQFGTVNVDLLKPIRLCAPANKRNEDPTAPSHLFHLLCYKTKNSGFGAVQTFTNDQFGPAQPLLIHRRELCVPSTKNGAVPTTTTSTTTPSTTTTSSSAPVTTTTTSTTTSTTAMSPSGAFLDEPVDLSH